MSSCQGERSTRRSKTRTRAAMAVPANYPPSLLQVSGTTLAYRMTIPPRTSYGGRSGSCWRLRQVAQRSAAKAALLAHALAVIPHRQPATAPPWRDAAHEHPKLLVAGASAGCAEPWSVRAPCRRRHLSPCDCGAKSLVSGDLPIVVPGGTGNAWANPPAAETPRRLVLEGGFVVDGGRDWHLKERAGALGFEDLRGYLQARCDAGYSIPRIATELGVRDWQVQAALARSEVRLALARSGWQPSGAATPSSGSPPAWPSWASPMWATT
jgi:hypothetical protein